ncbi:MAG TPA: trypsin-like peptidase domain-containing protein [Dehalococcoidia bacterium]|nr:trypsin-like peptidase domain-containing protein [Dehalococcoidia bacterium]
MERNWLHGTRTVATALGGALIAVVIMLAYLKLEPPGGKYNDAQIQALADERIKAVTPSPPVEPEIYNLVRPAVVVIMPDTPGADKTLGSGVVIDTNGNILTAYHVIAGSDTVTIRFADGSSTTGVVVQVQPERDLAVVRARALPRDLEPAVLAGGVRQGDRVLAIGAPFGLDGSVSEGVVSGLNRSFFVQETGHLVSGMIQFDAAVNPGNSGGPLVDMSGRVVAIVSGIVNPTNDHVFIGLGFAVPIESAAGIVAPLG